MQASGAAADEPGNARSSWFSNPGALNTAAPVREGVGKYIQQRALDAPLGSKKAAAAAAAAGGGGGGAAAAEAAAAPPPAAKKQKVAQGQMNFDAW